MRGKHIEIRITTLCENLVGWMVGLGEHGVPAFIKTDNGNYLFDKGNGHSIVENYHALDKDLRTKWKIFLSHGHSDHTGGLPDVLKVN